MSGSWIVRLVITMSVFIILSGGIAMAGESVEPDLCGNNDEFTTDFRIEDCKFKTKGENPYFILRPGYRVVLESDEEKSVETVLRDTKRIKFDGRRIRTRVLEERAFEWEEGVSTSSMLDLSKDLSANLSGVASLL